MKAMAVLIPIQCSLLFSFAIDRCSVQRLSEQECKAVVHAVYTGTEQCERVCSE